MLNLEWFSSITRETIRNLKGTTYVQIPARFAFAVQQAQDAVMKCIVHNETSSTECENAWKVLTMISWLLLVRPEAHDEDRSCAEHLDERLELFWVEDWETLWNHIQLDTQMPPIRKPVKSDMGSTQG